MKPSRIKIVVNLIALAEANGYQGVIDLRALYLTLNQLISSRALERLQ